MRIACRFIDTTIHKELVMALPKNPGKKRRIIVALYPEKEAAQHIVEKLIDEGFVMDEISLLGRTGEGKGDDLLGISYQGTGEKVKMWGEYGAFWGGVWGLLATASGMFLIPGIGPVAAAGSVVGAIIDVVAGTAAGAAVGGGVFAGAAAVSQLAAALHRQGVPKEKLQRLHDAIRAGKYLLLLRCGENEVDHWRSMLDGTGALEVDDFAYST
jgi:hypothetical protein